VLLPSRDARSRKRVAAAALDAVSTSTPWSAHRCARFSPMRKVWLLLHEFSGRAACARRQHGSWVAPLGAPTRPANLTQADLDARFAAVANHWRERLNRTRLRVPAARSRCRYLAYILAHILMSRDGPALRPARVSYGAPGCATVQ